MLAESVGNINYEEISRGIIKDPREAFLSRLICRDAVAEDLMVADFVLSLAAGVAYITFNGVHIVILDLLCKTNMVGQPVLGTGFVSGKNPVKENDRTGNRCSIAVRPLAALFEPVDESHTSGEFRNDTCIDRYLLNLVARCFCHFVA